MILSAVLFKKCSKVAEMHSHRKTMKKVLISFFLSGTFEVLRVEGPPASYYQNT